VVQVPGLGEGFSPAQAAAYGASGTTGCPASRVARKGSARRRARARGSAPGRRATETMTNVAAAGGSGQGARSARPVSLGPPRAARSRAGSFSPGSPCPADLEPGLPGAGANAAATLAACPGARSARDPGDVQRQRPRVTGPASARGGAAHPRATSAGPRPFAVWLVSLEPVTGSTSPAANLPHDGARPRESPGEQPPRENGAALPGRARRAGPARQGHRDRDGGLGSGPGSGTSAGWPQASGP